MQGEVQIAQTIKEKRFDFGAAASTRVTTTVDRSLALCRDATNHMIQGHCDGNKPPYVALIAWGVPPARRTRIVALIGVTQGLKFPGQDPTLH